MFKKIVDNNAASYVSYEFLRTFGYDCLRKIKNVQRKFNHVDWDVEKLPFAIVVMKIRSMLDCYQIIAHQIYNSFQTAELASLGHSVIKMFLQISSAIKWLVKSFSNCTLPEGNTKHFKNQNNIRESQAQKFRKKQINRFILKGVIGRMSTDQNEENQEGVYSLFRQSKQAYQNTKNKIMSIGTSNLPIMLEEAASYFTQKSQYLDKFIALRENYDGFYRIESLPTSQAIIESEHLMKNSEAFQKFKLLYNKFMQLENKKAEVNRIQFGVQVALPVITTSVTSEKLKKSVEQSKNKSILEQLQRQKYENKQLRSQIQAYQKRLNTSLTQFQEVAFKKKPKHLLSKFTKKNADSAVESSNSLTNQKEKQDQIDVKSEIGQAQGCKDQQNSRTSPVKRNSYALKKRSPYALRRNVSYQQYNEAKKQISLQIGLQITSQNQDKDIAIKQPSVLFNLHQVYDIKIENSSQNKQLKLQSAISDFCWNQLKKIELVEQKFETTDFQQFEQVSRRFISNKVAAFAPNHNSSITSTPISHADERFQPFSAKLCRRKQAAKQNKQVIQCNSKIERTNKINTNFTIQNKLDDEMRNISKKIKENIDFNAEFEREFIKKTITHKDISIQTINQFFINEQNAKNYELLNISQIFSTHKKGRLSNKHPKIRKCLGTLSITLGSQNKQNSYNIQLESMAYNIISRQLYKQINKSKKYDKEMYLTLILFFRYPFSLLYRKEEIRKKLDIQQENTLQMSQIQSHFRRIWAIHNNCYDLTGNISSVKWCSHKQYMLRFFGIEKREKNLADFQNI